MQHIDAVLVLLQNNVYNKANFAINIKTTFENDFYFNKKPSDKRRGIK